VASAIVANVELVVLNGLPEDESVKLLQSYRPDISLAVAKELANFVDGLPQALYVIGRYLSKYGGRPEIYLDALTKGQINDHIDEVFMPSYKDLDIRRENDKQVLELLFLAVYLDPGELIPHSLLYSIFFTSRILY